MSRVLVIPDIHLKPEIFDRAEKILESGQADFAVQTGDIVDDWGEELNARLYRQTLDRAIKFHKKFPKTLWCMGNHDFGYYFPKYGKKETGHSMYAEGSVSPYLKEFRVVGLEQEIIHIVDNVIFSHAGVTRKWAEKVMVDWGILDKIGNISLADFPDAVIEALINAVTGLELLWDQESPLWVRPQDVKKVMFTDKMQVVGHTPVRKIELMDNILSTDVFSTYSNGAPYGEQRFCIVGTETRSWRYVDEGGL